LLAVQKEKLPFFLYAYCLMTNHIHLLIERRADSIGRIMHRVLTGYSQYYNRKYRRPGHLLQGRHKAILCQSDRYLAELVRYIHLNPVRAKMVRKVENYPYSSHRAYIGLEPSGIVDVDPVLRRFAARKALARERFAQHVAAGMKLGHLADLYGTQSSVLGSEEFVDSMIHRMGEVNPKGTPRASEGIEIDPEELLSVVEKLCDVSREDLCSQAKGHRLVSTREILILAGRRAGLTAKALSDLTGLSVATISRRHEAATLRARQDTDMQALVGKAVTLATPEKGVRESSTK
jgi:putative transposase